LAQSPQAETVSAWSARCWDIRQARTTERYAHLSDNPLRAVADRTSERIAAIMKAGVGNVVPLAVPSRHKA
jgi:hypothetical protein